MWRAGCLCGEARFRGRACRTICDRDAIVFKIEQIGGAACAHGYRSCFYEHVREDGNMEVEGEPLFDPKAVYGQ